MSYSYSETSMTQSLDRKIRLKHLIDEGIIIEGMINTHRLEETIVAINNVVKASDEIISEGTVEDRVQHTTEVVMDAQVLKMSHELVSKVLQTKSEFNDVLYQNAIMGLVWKDDTINWKSITEKAIKVARPVRVQPTMLGSVDAEIKDTQAKERQQRRKTKVSKELQPELIDAPVREDTVLKKVQNTYKQISRIFKNDRTPIPFYKLIIDPDNFMNTVQNAFELSFLARDGIIAIEEGEDNYPAVRLATLAERESDKENSQSICTLTVELCQQMIVFYEIEEAMLKVSHGD